MYVSIQIGGTEEIGIPTKLVSDEAWRGIVERALRVLHERIGQSRRNAAGGQLKGYTTKPFHAPMDGVGTGATKVKPQGGRLSRSGRSMGFDSYPGFKRGLGRSGGTRDYNVSGSMLSNMRYVKISRGRILEIGWAGETQGRIAERWHLDENGALFAFSKKEQRVLVAEALKTMNSRLRTYGLDGLLGLVDTGEI